MTKPRAARSLFAQKTIRVVLLGLLSLAVLTTFAESSKKESSDDKTGREMHEEILKEMPVVTEGKLAEYVNQVGQRVAAVSNMPEQKFTFTLLDDPDINAFAIPGGYIYIHRGLINYLNTEAQLAAVLAHEVGHVTERHHARKGRAHIGSQITAGLLAILTRSSEVGEASALWGASLVQGYGRDMELEADGVGAQYLYRAGYPPQAMIEVVSLLKDHKRLEKKRARAAGRKPRTYHGLFASHPRNDTRLREVINQAGTLPQAPDAESNVVPFRLATEGMAWGRSTTSTEVPETRYQNNNLRFRLDFPKGWQHSADAKNSAVTGHNEQKTARLTLTLENRTTDSPRQFIKQQLGIPLLKKSEDFVQSRLQGHTGLIPGAKGAHDQRLAVIYYGRLAYVFRGEITGGETQKEADTEQANKDFIAIISSFRPLSSRAIQAQKGQTLHYVKATSRTTFAALAKHLQLGAFGEEELRIINGYYPSGEPKAGEWIKIIRQ